MVRLARRADSGELLLLFFPPYFQTMAVRLSLLAGRGSGDLAPWLLVRVRETDGQLLLLDEKAFGVEAQRAEFMAEKAAEGWRIASLDPYRSCVAVEPVSGLELVYKSQFRSLPAVKVFEVEGR